MASRITWTAWVWVPLSLALGTAALPPSVAASAAPAMAWQAGTDTVPSYRDPEVIRTENFTLSLGTRVQVRYSYLNPDDAPTHGSFGVRRARLSMEGAAYEHFGYAIQLELAGGSANLIDANIRYRPAPLATLWVGQGKAPFGRQQLNSSGNLNFVDRTIVDGRFSAGRQVGVSLLGQNEGRSFEYAVGLYNGNGINAANDNGKYLSVARAVWTPLGAYAPVESAHDYPGTPRVAVGAAVLRTTNGADLDATDVTRLNLEGAFKLRGLNLTGELYREDATPPGAARLRTTGWYAQAGYLLPDRRNEVAARYAVISPHGVVNADVVETGVAYSHYLHAHRAKIQADLRSVERRLSGTGDVEARFQIQLTL